MIQAKKTKKFSCKGVTNHKSKYVEDIDLKSSATLAKNKMPRKNTSICKKKANILGSSQSRKTRKTKDKNNSAGNTHFGVLELFELDKEYILLYHLSMLESKGR